MWNRIAWLSVVLVLVTGFMSGYYDEWNRSGLGVWEWSCSRWVVLEDIERVSRETVSYLRERMVEDGTER